MKTIHLTDNTQSKREGVSECVHMSVHTKNIFFLQTTKDLTVFDLSILVSPQISHRFSFSITVRVLVFSFLSEMTA